MKNTFALMATLSALTLTACGGGGGSDSPVSVNQPSNGGNPVVNPSTPTTPTTNGFVVSGKAIKFENGKQTAEIDSYSGTTTPPEYWGLIKIDGKELFYMHDGRGEVGHYGWAPQNGEWSYHDLGTVGYSRFGVMHDTKNNMEYVFYTGKEFITPLNEMPVTGTIEYGGYAVAYRPSDKKTFLTYANKNPYPVNFTVDFANKKLTGKIDEIYEQTDKNERIKDIELSATINGNTFSGSKNGVSTEGIFVGSKAAEMTGLFKDDNNKIQGAFGAKQQGK